MDAYHAVMVILAVGFLLMCVGFACRDHEWGMGLIAVGIVGMFGPIFYRLVYMMPS